MAISYSNSTQASPTHTGHEGVDVVEAEGERAGHELAEGGAGLLDHELQDPQELLDRPARQYQLISISLVNSHQVQKVQMRDGSGGRYDTAGNEMRKASARNQNKYKTRRILGCF